MKTILILAFSFQFSIFAYGQDLFAPNLGLGIAAASGGGTYTPNVARWKCQEGSGGTGTTITDDIGGFNGVLQALTWQTTSPSPPSGATTYLHSAGSQYVSVAKSASLNPAQFTLSVFVYVTSYPGSGIDCIWGGDRLGSVDFGLNTAGKIVLAKSDGSTVYGTSSSAIGTSAWHKIGCSYDGTTLTFYIDGTVSGSAGASPALVTPTTSYAIGNNLFTGESFIGNFCDFGISNMAQNPGSTFP